MNHRARKRFGQNFLTDRNAIDRIVAAVAPTTDQHLIEIGPGQAALTAALLPHCRRLTAIEIDRDLAAGLRDRFAGEAAFELHEGDALKTDFATLSDGPARLVGNLPYNISTPLIFHLLRSSVAWTDLHVMLQWEVAQRICAAPGGREYGRLSVAVQLAAKAEILFKVPPGAFVPPPKVHSAILRLNPMGADLPWRTLDRVLISAFSARRKTLRNALKNLTAPQQLMDLGLDPQARPETLTPPDYLRLALALDQSAESA